MQQPQAAEFFVLDVLSLVEQGGWDGKAASRTDIKDGMRGSHRAWRRPASRRQWSCSNYNMERALAKLVESGVLEEIADGNATRYRKRATGDQP